MYSLALPIEATLTIVSTGASPSSTSIAAANAAAIDPKKNWIYSVRSSEGLAINYK